MMTEQIEGQMTFDFQERPTIKGFPELRWTGKRPYRSTQYYPAQLKERYGEEKNGWINKIFWGDNLQVMSHMLKDYRGKIDLIYIDPPFDSRVDYHKKIKIKGDTVESESNAFEEKQYGDIWFNDSYIQFMYERLILMRELLSTNGSIYVHCDWHKSNYIRCLLDEVFGIDNFRNEITWKRGSVKGAKAKGNQFARNHDIILYYTKSDNYTFNRQYLPFSEEYKQRFSKDDHDGRGPYRDDQAIGTRSQESINEMIKEGRIVEVDGKLKIKTYLNELPGVVVDDNWIDIPEVNVMASDRTDYPTQKPEALVERIILASSNPGDIVFDCFMGSGTTLAASMRLGRKCIGADINLGAIQTTQKRLISNLNTSDISSEVIFENVGFEVYNVNNYDFFRNPVEAKELLISALEIQRFPNNNVWDGELDGRMVKIMPINHIATKADLEELKANLPYKTYEKRREENPNKPVEFITIVCMGHEPDLKGALEQELSDYKLDIEILDILRDKSEIQLKREAEAEIVREGTKLVIRAFYPMNLLQKLSLQKESINEWRQLVESVMIDWNYDGVVMQPSVMDIPDKSSFVSGIYDIPDTVGTIKVKITDLLSESLEVEV